MELILDATLGLVGTSHFSVVTMRDIALACEVNVALLYHYFGSKDQLIRAVLARALGQITGDYENRRLSHDDDFLGDIGAWFATHAAMAPTMMSRMVKLMSDQAAQPVKDPQLDILVQGFYRFERDLVVSTLEAGMAAGDTVRSKRRSSPGLSGCISTASSTPPKVVANCGLPKT